MPDFTRTPPFRIEGTSGRRTAAFFETGVPSGGDDYPDAEDSPTVYQGRRLSNPEFTKAVGNQDLTTVNTDEWHFIFDVHGDSYIAEGTKIWAWRENGCWYTASGSLLAKSFVVKTIDSLVGVDAATEVDGVRTAAEASADCYLINTDNELELLVDENDIPLPVQVFNVDLQALPPNQYMLAVEEAKTGRLIVQWTAMMLRASSDQNISQGANGTFVSPVGGGPSAQTLDIVHVEFGDYIKGSVAYLSWMGAWYVVQTECPS